MGLRFWVCKSGERITPNGNGEVRFQKSPCIVTCWHIFSLCGKLVGHFTVCSWLRVATAFIKRRANVLTKNWDDEVRNASLYHMLVETTARVCKSDSVKENWCVDGNEIKFKVDTSSELG